MHVAVHLDIRPSNGAIRVLHSRSPKPISICEVVQWMFELVFYWQHRLVTVEAVRSRLADLSYSIHR